jgi:trimeric autotransporter adhesin
MGCERLRVPTIVLAIGLIAGCNASYPDHPSPPVPTALQIHYPTPLISPTLVGQSFTLLAYIVNSDGAFEDVTSSATWVSSNSAVVQMVASPSRFSAFAPGLASVSATYRGVSNAVSVTVMEADRRFPMLTITPGVPRVVGQTVSAAALLRTNATQSQAVTSLAIWSSSDPNVVSVVLSGSSALVRGVGAGTAIVTAVFGDLSASYSLSILP